MTSIAPTVSPLPQRQSEDDIFDHVSWLLFFKSKHERQKFQRFFRERSTVKSFIPLALLIIITIYVIIVRWKDPAYGGLYHTKIRQIIILLCISIVTSMVAVALLIVRYFQAESRTSLIPAFLENLFMILSNLLFGFSLIISASGTQCVSQVEPIIQYCNPLRYSNSIPLGNMIFLLFLPVIGANLLRCADWWCFLVTLGMSVVQIIVACVMVGQNHGFASLAVIALLCLAIIYERRRTKVEYYLAFRKEFDCLNVKGEKDVAEAKCNAAILQQNELRHTIANIAHDLKTVSLHYFSRFFCLI